MFTTGLPRAQIASTFSLITKTPPGKRANKHQEKSLTNGPGPAELVRASKARGRDRGTRVTAETSCSTYSDVRVFDDKSGAGREGWNGGANGLREPLSTPRQTCVFQAAPDGLQDTSIMMPPRRPIANGHERRGD